MNRARHQMRHLRPLEPADLRCVRGGQTEPTSMTTTPVVSSYQKLLTHTYATGN